MATIVGTKNRESSIFFPGKNKGDDFPVPPFSGEDKEITVIAWASRVSEGIETAGWTDAQAAKNAKATLMGIARSHYDNHVAEADASDKLNEMALWSTMRKNFLKTFWADKVNAKDIAMRKSKLVQEVDESPGRYLVRVRSVIRESNQAIGIMKSDLYDTTVALPTGTCPTCNVEVEVRKCMRCLESFEQECFSWFLNGLRPDLKKKMETDTSTNTCDDAVRKLKPIFEASLTKGINEICRSNGVLESERYMYVSRLNAIRGVPEGKNTQVPKDVWETKKFGGRNANKDGLWECYYCRKMTNDHNSKSCPQRAAGVPKTPTPQRKKVDNVEKKGEKSKETGNESEMMRMMTEMMKEFEGLRTKVNSLSRPPSPTPSAPESPIGWSWRKN